MTNLIKKTIGGKAISLMFLALFASVFIGNEVYAMLTKQSTQEWLFDDSMPSADPLDPNHYVLYTGVGLAAACEDDKDICGIKAPEDPGNPGKPLIDSGLENRIDNSETNQGDVFLKPFNP